MGELKLGLKIEGRELRAGGGYWWGLCLRAEGLRIISHTQEEKTPLAMSPLVHKATSDYFI